LVAASLAGSPSSLLATSSTSDDVKRISVADINSGGIATSSNNIITSGQVSSQLLGGSESKSPKVGVPPPLFIPNDDKRSGDTSPSSDHGLLHRNQYTAPSITPSHLSNDNSSSSSSNSNRLNNGGVMTKLRTSTSVDDFNVEPRRAPALLAPCWPTLDSRPIPITVTNVNSGNSINNNFGNGLGSGLSGMVGSASVPNFQQLNNVPYQRRSETPSMRRLASFDAATTSSYAHSFRRKPRLLRKILSDVDDTLFCSGGSFPAGIDMVIVHTFLLH
jgi:hypothetical protein